MIFFTDEFLLLVSVTWLLYFFTPFRRFQVALLLGASLFFYCLHAPWACALLLVSASMNAVLAWLVAYREETFSRCTLIAGVGMNVGLLAFFKYSGLLAKSLLPAGAMPELTALLLAIPLPIGISFFTFQGISVLVDSCRARSSGNSLVPRKLGASWLHNTFFISFFPHSVAGPIVKAHDFLPQIGEKRLADIDWEHCFRTLVRGFFFKLVVADNLKDYTFWMQPPYYLGRSSWELLCMLFGYSIQIFADFYGYSLIAVGIAALFGYRLPPNFDRPYISVTFSEFWKRWHISLSSWLKEYLYIPLGGNRRGPSRTYVNLFITMLLGGIWHGAGWNYAAWGAAHGLFLGVERALGTRPSHRPSVRFLQGTLVFICVTAAWLLFRLENYGDVMAYLGRIAQGVPDEGGGGANPFYILLFSLPVVGFHAIPFLRLPLWRAVEWRYAAMLALLFLNGGSPSDFIYFRF